MQYDPYTTVLVVVDMQNDFCHPDGKLYAEGSEQAIEGVNRAIDNFTGEIWYTQDSHQEGDPEFEQWGEHCLLGSWGRGLHEDVTRVYPGYVQTKGSYDAFHETDFDSRLSDRDIDTLIFCGTLANVCVQETASTANLLGYDVYVVEDAVGYINEEQRDATLDHIDFLIGDIVETEDL
jgi:nicotinamidase-related amidase